MGECDQISSDEDDEVKVNCVDKNVKDVMISISII